ncbi:MAG: 50S ribosomal protein L17 [Caldithrix sp.]|nr:50S ribosomal protein L17 [Caldithrix sp.]
MRHKKRGNHLSRTTGHRKALMRNLAAQVFEYKEIKTTTAKAKELRSYVERLITYGKRGTLHHRRLAFRMLQNKDAVTNLFDEIAPAFESRAGGYTRVVKLGRRRGDGADLSLFQLVSFEKVAAPAKDETKKTRKKSAKGKKEEEKEGQVQKAQVEEQVTEEPKEEKPAKKDTKQDKKAAEVTEQPGEETVTEKDETAEEDETKQTENEDAKDKEDKPKK